LGEFSPLGQLLNFKNTKVAQFFGSAFSTEKVLYIFILTKTGWATFWAIFFTNSSGHPASGPHVRKADFLPFYVLF
jgi:hypothetical protein